MLFKLQIPGDMTVKSLVDTNEAELLRKRKFAEIVKESDFSTLGEVLQNHPTEFDPKVVDTIPLREETDPLLNTKISGFVALCFCFHLIEELIDITLTIGSLWLTVGFKWLSFLLVNIFFKSSYAELPPSFSQYPPLKPKMGVFGG